MNNSNVVESLGTQHFPIWANSPHFWNRDIPYRIHQNSQLTPVLNNTNPIRAFKSAPQVFKTIFLLEVFSSKYCTLGDLFARLPARSHYVLELPATDHLSTDFLVFFCVLKQNPKRFQSSVSFLHDTHATLRI